MRKGWIIVALIPAIIFYGIAIFFPNLLKIKSPLLEFIIVITGLTGLTIASYFLFKSKQIILFAVLGISFTMIGYIIASTLMKYYPLISIIMLIITSSLAILFFGIAVFKIYKDLVQRFK